MISQLQRAVIRRLFYAEHWPIGTIGDALDVHHDTVRRAVNPWTCAFDATNIVMTRKTD